MGYPIIFLGAVALLVLALFDIKYKSFPSFLPTAMIFGIITLQAFLFNYTSIILGILGLVFGVFLYDLGYFTGIGDIKAIIISFLTFSSTFNIILWMFLFAIIGFIYQSIIYLSGKKEGEPIPFIPLFFFVYVLTYTLLIATGGIY